MRSIITFGLMGMLSTVVHVLSGLLAHYRAGLSPFNANIVAYCAGFLVSYFGHRNFTFRSPGRISRSMPRFLAIALAGLLMSQAIVWLVVSMAGLAYWFALAVIVMTVPPATYVLGRIWAFSDGDF